MSKVIAFEGIDNCGKDTQVNRVTRWLERYTKNYNIVRIPSITDTNIGMVITRNKKLMTNPNQMIAMFIADFYNKLNIIANGSSNTIFVVNRWYYSTLAYSLDDSLYLPIKYLCGNTEIKPDIIFYLDIPIDVALTRQGKTSKGSDRYTNEPTLKYAQKVYDMLCLDKSNRMVRLDGTKTPKQTTDNIIKYLKQNNII